MATKGSVIVLHIKMLYHCYYASLDEQIKWYLKALYLHTYICTYANFYPFNGYVKRGGNTFKGKKCKIFQRLCAHTARD